MRLVAGILLGLLLAALPLRADEVHRAKGKPVVGTARRVGDRVLVNPYGSTLDAMTWGVVEIPAAEVEEIVRASDAGRLLAGLDPLAWRDVAGRASLLEEARRIRARKTARRLAAEILRVEPDHAAALAAIGGPARWAKRRRGSLALAAELRALVARALREDGARRRRAVLTRAGEALGWEADPDTVERMARSLREPRGVHHDVALAWPDAAGATCSLYVPEDLHPLEPRPLVVALHGGMPEGGDAVLGTGRDAFELFVGEARRRGWLLAAPTAHSAPWHRAEGVDLVEALIEEIGAHYAVDLERVYLVGQGDGADGALALEGRITGTFAAVGAAGAAKPEAARGPTSRRVGVWLYHGEADQVVPVAAAREAAEGLRRRGADFVYTELPGMGHGLPAAAEQDLYRFLARHRRPRARGPWPRLSLAEAVSGAEARVLGRPGAAWAADLPDETDALVERLRAGGPEAEAAARELVRRSVAPHAVLADRAVATEGRAWAAWACGRLRAFEALDALADAVRAEEDPFLRRQAATALRRLGVPEAAYDLAAAIEEVSGVFARGASAEEPLVFDALDTTSRLLAALIEAYAVSSPGDEAGGGIEAHVVLAVLKDGRPVRARPELGEDATAPRVRLARAVGRAYRTLGAEKTLMDMLRVILEKQPAVLEAAVDGYGEGVVRDD